MRFSVLSSGSKANCTFVEACGLRFLVDCGLSGKQAEERMAEIKKTAQKVRQKLKGICFGGEHCLCVFWGEHCL